MDKVFNFIDKALAEYVSFLKEICSFEATAYDKEEMDKMVDYIEEFALSKDFYVERRILKDCGDFLTIDINRGEEKGNMFLAHMDTVHKKGAFGYPCVKIEGDRMTGPGTIDCKGGIAIALLTMDALKNSGYKKHTRLILTSDEEISNVLGGEEEQEFIKASVKGFKSALNCETTYGNEVTVARKGILRKEVTIKGVGGHSGIDYFNSSSAILEAAYKIVEIERHSQIGSNTYNCSVINGGSTPNCIPDRCSFIVDIRVINYDDMEKAESLVNEIANKSFVKGTTAQVRNISKRPPMERNPITDTLYEEINKVSVKYGLGELIPVVSGGGSDSAYTKLAGIPSLCGLGGSGEFCHTNNEYIEINSITKRAKMLSAFCWREKI